MNYYNLKYAIDYQDYEEFSEDMDMAKKVNMVNG